MNEEEQSSPDMKQYYVLGAVVLIAVIIAGYLLKPKNVMPTPTTQQVVVPTATPLPGPITKLGCDTQYFNPRVGFPEYYLSVEGGDLSTASSVNCTFTASQSGKIVATTKVTSPLTDKPERAGKTFRCTTQATALTPRVATIVTVVLSDDQGATASCSAPFVFPAP